MMMIVDSSLRDGKKNLRTKRGEGQRSAEMALRGKWVEVVETPRLSSLRSRGDTNRGTDSIH